MILFVKKKATGASLPSSGIKSLCSGFKDQEGSWDTTHCLPTCEKHLTSGILFSSHSNLWKSGVIWIHRWSKHILRNLSSAYVSTNKWKVQLGPSSPHTIVFFCFMSGRWLFLKWESFSPNPLSDSQFLMKRVGFGSVCGVVVSESKITLGTNIYWSFIINQKKIYGQKEWVLLIGLL